MKQFQKIIFVARSGNCREAMAVGILKDFMLKREVEILGRGLVVSFPEPMNQKAEAVLISNGITLSEFVSIELAEADIDEDTLILTMEKAQKDKVLARFPQAQNVYVLTEFVGDELEIIDPYGGALPAYGLCYETLRKSIMKLVKFLNEEGE